MVLLQFNIQNDFNKNCHNGAITNSSFRPLQHKMASSCLMLFRANRVPLVPKGYKKKLDYNVKDKPVLMEMFF